MRRNRRRKLQKILPDFLFSFLRTSWKNIEQIRFSLSKIMRTGNRYECNICRNRSRSFLVGGEASKASLVNQLVGAGQRKNCICPSCRSSDRERLIYLYLKKETNILDRPSSIFHVAPEEILKREFAAHKHIRYVNVDLDPTAADLQMDVTDIKFSNEEFDVVICNHVLEHVIDEKKAMEEIYRVLKPDGWAILQVPISTNLDRTYEDNSVTKEEDREAHFGQYNHVRLYGRDYPNRLRTVGFRVVEFQPLERWGLTTVENHALAINETIFLGYKGAYAVDV